MQAQGEAASSLFMLYKPVVEPCSGNGGSRVAMEGYPLLLKVMEPFM